MAKKKTYEQGLQDGKDVCVRAYQPVLEDLRRQIRELELEILINKRDWVSIKITKK